MDLDLAHAAIKSVLSNYIEARENLQRGTLIVAGQGPLGRTSQFSRMVDVHHMALGEYLPTLNLAEMEALSELVNSRLAWMRMKHER